MPITTQITYMHKQFLYEQQRLFNYLRTLYSPKISNGSITQV